MIIIINIFVMEKILSIIIPVYNVDLYIKDCIESIICEKENYEIIIINDGSTDRTLDICESYAKKYSFIKLYNQKNKGVSVARNVGLQKAVGKYIFFIDGDDYLIGLSSIIDDLMYNEADMFAIGYNFLKQEDVVFKKRYEGCKISSINVFYPKKEKTMHALWGFVFRHDIINTWHIQFDSSLRYAEDWLFFINYIINSRIVCISLNGIYVYRLFREGSAMNTNLKPQHLMSHFYVLKLMERIRYNVEYTKIIKQEKQILLLFIITLLKKMPKVVVLSIENLQKEIRKSIKMYMLFNTSLKNFFKILLAYINIKLLFLFKE